MVLSRFDSITFMLLFQKHRDQYQLLRMKKSGTVYRPTIQTGTWKETGNCPHRYVPIFGSNSLNLNLRNGRGENDQQSYLRLRHPTSTVFFFVKFPEFEPTECKCEGSTFDGNKFDLTVIQMEWCKLEMVYI